MSCGDAVVAFRRRRFLGASGRQAIPFIQDGLAEFIKPKQPECPLPVKVQDPEVVGLAQVMHDRVEMSPVPRLDRVDGQLVGHEFFDPFTLQLFD